MDTQAQTSPEPPEKRAPAIVEMAGVRFTWPGKSAFSLSIDQFRLRQGSRVLLIGPSGSGKSTFLSLLCGVITPQTGRINILGVEMASMSSSQRDGFRADHFGIIFQAFNLLPYGSILDNVMLPLRFSSQRWTKATRLLPANLEAERLLASLGLEPALLRDATASKLSVGQQQRVAAARALIGRPELIVADEPTSSIDRNRQVAFLDLLFAEAGASGATVIMVSHDETLASRFDEVLRLDDFAIGSRNDLR